MNDNENLEAIANSLYTMAGDMIAEGQKPFAVAAVFTMIALQIYKSSLSEQEYNLMVDSISENRHKIKSLTTMVNNPELKKFH